MVRRAKAHPVWSLVIIAVAVLFAYMLVVGIVGGRGSGSGGVGDIRPGQTKQP